MNLGTAARRRTHPASTAKARAAAESSRTGLLKRFERVRIDVQLAIFAVPLLTLVVVLAYFYLSRFVGDYRELTRVRDLVALANQFSEISEALNAETSAKMW